MNGEIEQAIQYVEERKVDALATLVPKVIEPNTLIFVWDRNGQVIKQGSLLHIAAYCGSLDCIRFLIDHKVEIDKRDEFGRTPIYMACISGYLTAVQLLLEEGADPNIRDMHYVSFISNWSPLHRAVLWSHISVIKLLIAAGVDPKAADDNGWTPLHLAAKWDHFEAAEILLAAGADVNMPNFDKKTPYELAFMFGRTKVGRVLRKAGGDVSQEYNKHLTSEEKTALSKFG